MTELYLNSSIEDVSGVGPKVKIQLEKLGIESVQDALFFLPKSYENRIYRKPGFQKMTKYCLVCIRGQAPLEEAWVLW